jgi:prepilin-type N-terminal cleavage/methylation domain-containing protein
MRLLRRLASDERGFSLPELLIAMVLMLIVLDATLMVFGQFEINTRAATVRNDTQDRTRNALDRIAHDLRSLSGTTPALAPIAKASDYDLVFLTVNPVGPNSGQNAANTQRVRYCLDNSNPANEVLWSQTQTWTAATAPAVPDTSACPSADANWNAGNLRYADKITNEYNNQLRPLFSFTGDPNTLSTISLIHADLWVNTNTGTGPPLESHLSTGVYLRNQDQPPTAIFTAQAQSNYRVVLNGSQSYSPQGSTLTYVWYDGATKISSCTATAIPCVYTASSGGAHILQLKAFDPAGLEGDSATQTVTLFQ